MPSILGDRMHLDRLHPKVLQLSPTNTAKLCSAYSHLGFQHHTVFKEAGMCVFFGGESFKKTNVRVGWAYVFLLVVLIVFDD